MGPIRKLLTDGENQLPVIISEKMRPATQTVCKKWNKKQRGRKLEKFCLMMRILNMHHHDLWSRNLTSFSLSVYCSANCHCSVNLELWRPFCFLYDGQAEHELRGEEKSEVSVTLNRYLPHGETISVSRHWKSQKWEVIFFCSACLWVSEASLIKCQQYQN